MSVEEAWRLVAQSDEGKKFMGACYVGDDIVACAHRFIESEEFSALKMLLSKYGLGTKVTQVLEIGAGNGVVSYALSKIGFKVVALEPDPSMLTGFGAIGQLVKKTEAHIQILSALGEYLPFREGQFDLVFCHSVLHHVSNLTHVVSESKRVLKHSGVFIVCREPVISKKSDLAEFLKKNPIHQYTGCENAYLLKKYTDTFKEMGFQIKEILKSQESVINYYPMTRYEFIQNAKAQYQRRLGRLFGNWISDIPLFQIIYGKCVSMRDHTPGRMFSFVCRNP